MLKELKKIKDLEDLSYLLNIERKSIIDKYKNNNTILHVAVYTGNLKVVKIVYESLRLCNFHFKALKHLNLKGQTPALVAYHLRYPDIFQWLQAKASSKKRVSLASTTYQDFYFNLEKTKINVKSTLVFFSNGNQKQIAVSSARESLIKCFDIFNPSIETQVWNNKLPSFNWVVPIFGIPILTLKKDFKIYPWKKINTNKSNCYLNNYFIKIDTEQFQALRKKNNYDCLKEISIICAICDEVFQEQLLRKKTTTTNFLIVDTAYSSQTESSIAWHPFLMKANPNLNKKLSRASRSIKRSLVFQSFKRIEGLFKQLNYLSLTNLGEFKKEVNGVKSSFASYRFLNQVNPGIEVQGVVIERANPLNKICVSIGFSDKNLVLGLDIHPQVLETREDILKILDEIKLRINQYAQS